MVTCPCAVCCHRFKKPARTVRDHKQRYGLHLKRTKSQLELRYSALAVEREKRNASAPAWPADDDAVPEFHAESDDDASQFYTELISDDENYDCDDEINEISSEDEDALEKSYHNLCLRLVEIKSHEAVSWSSMVHIAEAYSEALSWLFGISMHIACMIDHPTLRTLASHFSMQEHSNGSSGGSRCMHTINT